MRLLIVDDDRSAARLVAKSLRAEQFVVDLARTAADGDELATVNIYDAILLDVTLPDKDGIVVCRDLRARGISTPILMLTARGSDRVTGLRAGADDCLTQPIAFDELLARIHALLRRSHLTRPTVLRVADLTLNPLTHRVTRDGRAIHLTVKEYTILAVLMRHTGRLVTRAQLIGSVWAVDDVSASNALDVHVSHLRKKVDRTNAKPLIHTIRGAGYLIGRPK